MIEIKSTVAWLYVYDIDGKCTLPLGAVKVKDRVYRLPHTPYHISYVVDNNKLSNKEMISNWHKEFKKHDNQNLENIMKLLKSNETKYVPELKKTFSKSKMNLWDMLMNHQVLTTYLALRNNSYGIFFDMGAGKTLTSLQIASIRLEKQQTESVLIVAPAPLMRPVWESHLTMIRDRYNKDITYEVLDGTRLDRIKQLKETKSMFYIINYEMLAKLHAALVAKGFNMLIFDESTRIKNNKAKTTTVALDLAARMRYKLVLSGTPIQTTELDIHSQIAVLEQGSFFNPLPMNFYAFRNKWFYQPNNYKFAPFLLRKDKKEELNKAIYSMSIRYKAEECIQLPPISIQKLYFDMDKTQKGIYKSIKDNLITYISNHNVQAHIAITKLMKLAEVTSGFVIDDSGKAVRFSNNPKLDMVEELVEEINDKTVIFCRFKETIKILKHRLSQTKHVVTYFGEDTKKSKEEALHKFEHDKDTKVFIAQLASGGFGLNLQFAHHMIFCELDYLNYKQSLARIRRNGQLHKCFAYILMGKNTIDEDMFNLAQNKDNNAEAVLKTIMRRLTN